MKWTVLLGLGFLCCVNTVAQQETRQLDTEPWIWAGLQSGAYDVGVDVAVGSGDLAITLWRAALLLAMHDSSVKALVSLDGGIGTASAIDAFKRAPWFSLSRPVPPVLHMYESADPFMAPDFSLLRALRSPNLVLRELTGLHHVHFSTLGFQASRDGSIAQLTNFGAAGTASLRAMAEEVRKFLQAQLSVSRAR